MTKRCAVLVHGFQGRGWHFEHWKEHLSKQVKDDEDWVVVCPDLPKLVGCSCNLDQYRSNAVLFVVNLVKKLAEEQDCKEVALVGHSAGGAVVSEAALALGRGYVSVILLLDAVPWARTLRALKEDGEHHKFQVCSLRCPPSSWNANGWTEEIQLSGQESGAFSVEEDGFVEVMLKGGKQGDFVPNLVKMTGMKRLGLQLLGVVASSRDIGECGINLGLTFLECWGKSDFTTFNELCEKLETEGMIKKRQGKIDRRETKTNKLPRYLQ